MNINKIDKNKDEFLEWVDIQNKLKDGTIEGHYIEIDYTNLI